MLTRRKAQPSLAETVSVVALARQPGLIGRILRWLPEWMLSAADRWAEQTLEWKKRRDTPSRLPLPDPWQFLLDASAVPPGVKTVCRAAQSQFPAWRRIGRMRMGFATLHDDLHERAMKAKAKGNKVEYARVIAKFANWMVVYEPIQADVRASTDDPEIIRHMEHVLKIRRAQLAHRGRGEDVRRPRHWPKWAEFANSNKLPVALVSWWVALPDVVKLRPPTGGRPGLLLRPGTPGLMFFRNEALTEFLKFATGNGNLTPATVKKVRQELRLVPVGDHWHLVWKVSITRRVDGDWEMELNTRCNKNRPSYIRRPTRVFRQVVAALPRSGFSKVGVGLWVRTTSQAKWRLKTCHDLADDDYFWIVVSRR